MFALFPNALCLFFKSEQFQLIDMPIQVGASVDKHGHVKHAHTRIQKVRVVKPAAPQHQASMFDDAPAQPTKKATKLDTFIRKHGGLASLAHIMAGLTEGQQQRIFTEMGKLSGQTAVEVSTLFDHIKPEASAQNDLFSQPKKANHVPQAVKSVQAKEKGQPQGSATTDAAEPAEGANPVPESEAAKVKPKIAHNVQKKLTNEPEPENRATLPFGVQAGISKQARRDLNAKGAAIVTRGGAITDADKAILRQYSGNGGCGDSLNEFYTLPAVAAAMWQVAQSLGMKGSVLEPSCGPGVFLHTAPVGSRVTGVEMDPVSAKIAKALHGDRHEVANASLERFATQDDRQFDGVLGNVPFGLRGSLIKDDKPKLKTADAYFCDTSMDKCKAGGIVGLIVPTGIMDSRTNRKLREAMLRKGQFLGAQRMPNTAFEHSHTEVTTDVVWFRKYPDDVAGALSSPAITQDHLQAMGVWDDDYLAGNYFTGRGAGNVLGTMGEGWRAKAGMGADITVEGGMRDVPQAIAAFKPEAGTAIPSVSDILAAVGDDEKTREKVLGAALARPYADKSKVGDTKMMDGIAYVLQGKPPRWHRVDEVVASPALTQGQELAGRIEALMGGMEAVDRPQLEADLKLWVLAHGLPSKHKDILLGAQQDKTLYRLIGAVNGQGEFSDAVTGTVAKAHQGNFEATVQSLLNDHETAAVRSIAKSAGIDDDEAADQLYGSNKYAIDPATGEWTTRDIYLSGSLWPKLDAAKQALTGELAPELRKKIEVQAAALNEAIAPVSLEEAFIQVNSAFLPTTMLSAFLTWKNKEAPDANKWTKELPPTVVTFADGVYTLAGGNSWGDNKHLDKFLNRTGLKKDDKHIIDDMNLDFKDWLCASPEYRTQAEDLYNRAFRGFKEREFSNEPMDIPGMNTDGLKAYQWGGLRWALNAGKGIIAADVGLGKTARGLMLAATLKNTGRAKRPMIVVPKSVLANWEAEAEKWFPGSKVLSIGGAKDNPAERKRKYHDLQQNDYDFIIISEPSFEELDLDPVTKGEYNSKDFWVQRGEKLGNAGDKRTNQIKTAWDQARAGQEFSEKDRTDATYFNNLGVDCVIADEMHHCFPAGTLVDGVPIERLAAGDLVKSFNHETKEVELKSVLAVAKLPAKPLARITLSNGQQIVSTFDHRFFTNEFGYVEAQHLTDFCSVITNNTKTLMKGSYECNVQKVRESIFVEFETEKNSGTRRKCGLQCGMSIRKDGAGSGERLHAVWQGIYAEPCAEVEKQNGEDGQVLLHEELFGYMAGCAAGITGLAANPRNKEETQRSIEGTQLASNTGISCEENGGFSINGSDQPSGSASSRGKWDGSDGSSKIPSRCFVVGNGVCSPDKDAAGIVLSTILQTGHSQPNDDDCGRSGRREPRLICAASSGQKENGVLGVAWVVGVEILEQGSDGEFERLCPSGVVYDIEVEGNHNFFAEGVLVHNCKNLVSVKSRFGESPKFLGGGGQSMRALDFNLKSRWLLDQNDGKNVFGLTATPTKNSPLELYSLLSHVAPEAFEKIGIRNSEEFLDRFAKFEDAMAMTTAGKMEEALITAGFNNMDELRTVLKRYIDRTTAADVGLQLPQRQDVQHMIDMDDAQQTAYAELRELATKAGGKDATGDAHIFSVMDKMNKAATDMSLLEPSYDATKAPKYVACAKEIMTNVKDGGQIVFSDYVDSHEKIAAALVASGIPRNQIGIINANAAPSSANRQKICDAFNAGRLKVVIGNTSTMGEGLNLQKGTSDIHHLDLPWEPASMQQRNGRGLRQGNTNKGVRIHSYLTKGSFDGYRLQTIMAKKDWQDAVWNGGNEIENLNKQDVNRDELFIMLAADPDQARKAYAENYAAKEERLTAGKTTEAAQRFVKFQEVKRSYTALKNKDSQSAMRLKVKMDKEYSALRADRYFTAKQALDMDAVIVAHTGALLHSGAGIELADGDKSGKWVVTGVDPRKGEVAMRRYGDETGHDKRVLDVKDLPNPKAFAFSEAAETEEINRKIADRPIDIKSMKDLQGVPPAVLTSNYAKIQAQLWDGTKNYTISHSGDVPMVEKATGMLKMVPHYFIGGTSNKDGVGPATHDFMLPTEDHKAKVLQAWMEAERSAKFGTETTTARRGGKTTTAAKRTYGSTIDFRNPWGTALHESSGDMGHYYAGSGMDSAPIKAARAQLHAEQLARIKRADSFAGALNEVTPLGEITNPGDGHGATVKYPKRALAMLWAKARQEGVLNAPINNLVPKAPIGNSVTLYNQHGGYFLGGASGSVHGALLRMAGKSGHDDLVRAMVESGLRHNPKGDHNGALSILSDAYGYSPDRLKAMQRLAHAAGVSDKTIHESRLNGALASRSAFSPDGSISVRDKLAQMLAYATR